jgi:hypothetical protein
MTFFGGGSPAQPTPQTVTPAAASTPAPTPAYTPTHADPSVITAGLQLVGKPGASTKPEFSTKFASLVGGAGGLGRLPSLARRSLIGGA